jgi:hypothetical protein
VAIRLVVLSIVSDQVVETEPVVRSDEVYALERPIDIQRAVGKEVIAPI